MTKKHFIALADAIKTSRAPFTQAHLETLADFEQSVTDLTVEYCSGDVLENDEIDKCRVCGQDIPSRCAGVCDKCTAEKRA